MIQTSKLKTSRLEQLTGNYDPQGFGHVNFTVAWKCIGVDLGANTEFDNATFIYFGDVVTPDSHHGLYNTDLIAYLDHVQFVAGGGLATAYQVDSNQLDVFCVDTNGRLYVSWVVGGGVWQGPVRISPKNIAPPGANVATAHQIDNNQLDVFFIGNDGGLYVSWVLGLGIWSGPLRVSPERIAPPGTGITTSYQIDNNQLDVFFIGNDGGLYVSWVIGGGVWQGPVRITPDRIAPAGAHVAAAHQVNNNQLDVFFIGNDGGLYVSWVIGGGIWQGPVRITPDHIAPPGAGVALAYQVSSNQLDVFFIGNDGGLYVSWVIGGGIWQGPVRITPDHIALPGANVSTAYQASSNQLDVFFIGNDGGLYVSWVIGGGIWQGPVRISQPGRAPQGAGVATANQVNNQQLDVFFTGNNTGLNVAWVIGGGIWNEAFNVSSGFRLTPIMQGDHFYPFTYLWDGIERTIPGDGTPTGAFSYDNKIFVFFFHGLPDGAYFSGLSVTSNPFAAAPYQMLFKVSTASNPKYFQVAPFVISNSEYAGFLPRSDGDGLIFFGHGFNAADQASGVHLAWMPLQHGTFPSKDQIRFYARHLSPPWSEHEEDATLFFKTQRWSSISVGRIPGTGLWIFLNQTCGGREFPDTYNGPIIARIAKTPWEIATAAPLQIFDPLNDNARGNFMFSPDRFEPFISHPSFAYGPYILNHYTVWDDNAHNLTIRYLMSTGSPYQVQVMESVIHVQDNTRSTFLGSLIAKIASLFNKIFHK